MDELTLALISRALDGLHQRYLFTAQNIANANTEGYRPVRVSFEQNLRAAMDQGEARAVAGAAIETRVDQTMPEGAAMRLDLELAAASQTAARYRALIEIMGRRLALQRSVTASGG